MLPEVLGIYLLEPVYSNCLGALGIWTAGGLKRVTISSYDSLEFVPHEDSFSKLACILLLAAMEEQIASIGKMIGHDARSQLRIALLNSEEDRL